jgi:hypothetical protein
MVYCLCQTGFHALETFAADPQLRPGKPPLRFFFGKALLHLAEIMNPFLCRNLFRMMSRVLLHALETPSATSNFLPLLHKDRIPEDIAIWI